MKFKQVLTVLKVTPGKSTIELIKSLREGDVIEMMLDTPSWGKPIIAMRCNGLTHQTSEGFLDRILSNIKYKTEL